jgi:hypothetical protein
MVAVLGVFLFHEPANAMKVVAIVLIIAGVVCLDLSSRNGSRKATSVQADLRAEQPMNQPQPRTTGAHVVSVSARPATGSSLR